MKLKQIKELVVLIYLSMSLLTSAFAQEQTVIGMVTGPVNGTSYHIGRDIAVLANQIGISISVKSSSGSLENIARLESTENAGLAIVQSDVLSYLKSSNYPIHQNQSQKLRMLFPLYNDEVHIFVTSDIQSIQDLAGKRVIIGARNSGTDLTANNVLNMYDVVPSELIYMGPEEGLSAIMQQETADAMFYVAGAPDALLSQLSRLPARILDNYHFLPLSAQSDQTVYTPATLSKQHYPWLSEDVPTLAVRSVLVAYDFSRGINDYHRLRCQQFYALSALIRDKFSLLQLNGHSKWQQVDLNSRVTDWPQDSCSIVSE